MGVTWLAKLVDGVSGPAKAATAALRALGAAARATDGAGTGKLVSDLNKVAHVEGQINAALKAQQALRKGLAGGTPLHGGPSSPIPTMPAGGGLGGLGGGAAFGLGAAGAAVAAASAAITAVEKVAELTGELLIAGGEMAIKWTTFRSMAVESFKAMTGSSAIANSMYDQAITLSQKLGETPERAIGQVKKLLSAGLKPSDIAPAITAIENATVGISEKAGSAVERSLTKIGAKGFMDNRALTQLAAAGISTQAIYAALSKRMNKSVKEVEMLTRKGKVDATDAIAAIEEVVNKKSGGMAQKRGQSIPGLFGAIGTQLGGLFDKIDTSPLQGAMKSALGALKGGAGVELKGALTSLGSNLFETLFGSFKGAEGQKRLERILHEVTAAVKAADKAITKARPMIQWLIGKLTEGDGKGGKGKGLGFLSKMKKNALDLGGGALGLGPIGTMMEAWDKYEFDPSVITNPIKNAFEAVGDFAAQFLDAGGQLMDGLIQGIEDGAGAVVDAVVAAVSGAIDAAKSALGIASPSTVFAGIGDFTAQGFAEGMGSSDEPSRAADRMARAPIAAAQAAGAPSALGGKGGGRQVSIDVGGIKVDARGGDAQDIRQNVERELSRALEGIGLELGA